MKTRIAITVVVALFIFSVVASAQDNSGLVRWEAAMARHDAAMDRWEKAERAAAMYRPIEEVANAGRRNHGSVGNFFRDMIPNGTDVKQALIHGAIEYGVQQPLIHEMKAMRREQAQGFLGLGTQMSFGFNKMSAEHLALSTQMSSGFMGLGKQIGEGNASLSKQLTYVGNDVIAAGNMLAKVQSSVDTANDGIGKLQSGINDIGKGVNTLLPPCVVHTPFDSPGTIHTNPEPCQKP